LVLQQGVKRGAGLVRGQQVVPQAPAVGLRRAEDFFGLDPAFELVEPFPKKRRLSAANLSSTAPICGASRRKSSTASGVHGCSKLQSATSAAQMRSCAARLALASLARSPWAASVASCSADSAASLASAKASDQTWRTCSQCSVGEPSGAYS